MIVSIDINFTIYLVKHDLGQRTRDTATGASTQAQPARGRERASLLHLDGWLRIAATTPPAPRTGWYAMSLATSDGQTDSGTDGHQWTDTRHGSRAPFSNRDPLRHETEEKEERSRARFRLNFHARLMCTPIRILFK